MSSSGEKKRKENNLNWGLREAFPEEAPFHPKKAEAVTMWGTALSLATWRK